GDLRLADGTNVELVDTFVEALGKQAVDDFLANFSSKTAADDGFRHLSGAEAGNLGVFPIVGGDFAEGRGYFVGGDIDDQFTGAIGVQNRAVLLVVRSFGVIVFVLGFSRFRFAFEGA